MQTRTITSKTYGYAEKFYLAGEKHKHLYRNESGRIYLLGEGEIGGKSKGLIFLDKKSKDLGYDIPRVNLIVCNDHFSIPSQPISNPRQVETIEGNAFFELLEIMQELGLDLYTGFRSSAKIEDKAAGQSAAGIFSSRLSYLLEEFETRTQNALLDVLNSNYSPQARAYYKKRGFQQIPPMPLIIQPLIGERSQWDWNILMPQFSGIINTGSPDKIKVAATFGFGQAAVGPQGLGVTHSFNSDLTLIEAKGELPYFFFGLNPDTNTFFPYRFDFTTAHIYTSLVKSFYSGISPHLQKTLAGIGLELQKTIGQPVDAEWALGPTTSPYLIQARPTRAKMSYFPKPEIEGQNILLETKESIGQGEKEIRHVIYVDAKYDLPDKKNIEELDVKYPGSLFMLHIPVPEASHPYFHQFFTYELWANAAAAVIIDTKEHSFGSGLQHMALNCIDEDKLLLHTTDIYLNERITEKGELIEDFSPSDSLAVAQVYKLPSPLRIAADDENGWGLIYQG